MMSVNDKTNYHNIIRELIKHEDAVRNSRNNWFFAIQGLLVNAYIITLTHQEELKVYLVICLVLAIIGLVTSFSFLYAVWRSEKSISMALACWNSFLIKNGKTIQDYPPIALITSGIIGMQSQDNLFGAVDWERDLNKMMNLKRIDKGLNKIDCFMPFKVLPIIFTVLWFFILLYTAVLLWKTCITI